MACKEFEVEFVVRGRFTIDPTLVEVVCNEAAAKIVDEEGQPALDGGKEWLESPYGIALQAAALDTVMSHPELLSGILLDKGAFLAGNCLSEGDGGVLGRLNEPELLNLLVKNMPPAHRKVIQEIADGELDVDLNLPVLFEDGRFKRGCFEVSEPFSVVLASVSEKK